MSSRSAEPAAGAVTVPAPAAPWSDRLARAVLSLRPLLDVLPGPVSVDGGTRAEAAQRVLHRTTDLLGLPRIEVRPGGATDPFDRVVGGCLGLAELPIDDPDPVERIDAAAKAALAADFDRFTTRLEAVSPDGVPLRVHTAGDPADRAVVLVLAPGMPARLAEHWIRELAREHHVVTWESRGLFGDLAAPPPADFGVPAQAGDLVAAMDRAGVRRAHVAGLCGGAVLAVAAAARHPDRIASLSLWHGDFDLGPGSPKTDHQRNLQALMELAALDRSSAEAIHATLLEAIGGDVPAELAPLVLYPYATVELFARYCELNSAVMGTDLRPELARVTAPALVVTSEDDGTAHPEGSARVAGVLAGARLLIRPHGDHLSLFRGGPDLLGALARFLADQHAQARSGGSGQP
ncbi:alpha/beta fold hydrolase [Kitasatospora sp. NPDC001175]|uniref:alpha/beta fold hydrolase n=1 Tax=Kitasatospora sp. NPDC001175 TaxID=3157103 RepID=UPI003CFE315B